MRLIYGGVTFIPAAIDSKQEKTEAARTITAAFSAALSKTPGVGDVFIIEKHAGLSETAVLFAMVAKKGFPKSEEDALEFFSKHLNSRNMLSGDIAGFSVSVKPEKVFVSEVNSAFLSAGQEERLTIQGILKKLSQKAGKTLSTDSMRMLEVVLSYRPAPIKVKKPVPPPEAEQGEAAGTKNAASAGEMVANETAPRNIIADRLRELSGFTEFKGYMDELESIGAYLSRWKGRADFPNQHLLFSVDPGNGCTTALKLLYEYIKDTGLHGTKDGGRNLRYLEHSLKYPAEDVMQKQQMGEILSAFRQEAQDVSPGIMGVHIEEWLSHLESPYFTEMLDYCRQYRHEIVFVFIVPYLEEGVLSRVRSRLNDILNVRLIRFHPYTAEELTQAARTHLGRYGIGWEESADEHFHRLLTEERSDSKFYGLRTVNKMGTELLLMKAKNMCVRRTETPLDIMTARDFEAARPQENSVNGFAKLDALIGLEGVKKRVRELVASIQAEKEFSGNQEGYVSPCLHMLFTGSPGTGKTTVARIVGQIFREAGLLRVGDLIAVNRFDLVGEYIGSTGPKTVAACRSAMGSILFIDEAYLLYPTADPNDRDTGKEALGALVAEMENYRDRFMVIMSGYADEMERMLSANPGLRGRIPHVLNFPSYSCEELVEIFRYQLSGYDFDESLIEGAKAFFEGISRDFLESRDFSNARFVRNLIERLRIKALLRLQGAAKNPGGRLHLIPMDLETALSDEDMRTFNRKEKKVRIGF